MTHVYLFDWGDTLMIDFPGVPGKMCDWEKVEAVEGAEDALRFLSKDAAIYIATSASDSTEEDIHAAFHRVRLDQYISDYFCKANIGIEKGGSEFLSRILAKLGKEPSEVTMVGDSLEKDIKPAIKLGLDAVWLSHIPSSELTSGVRMIASLSELCQEIR